MATIHLRATSIGDIARDLLSESGDFDVAAVFDRSAYLQLPGGFVCIGAPEIGKGPINVLLDVPAGATMAALGFTREAEGACSGMTLSIDEGPVIDVEAATVWSVSHSPAWSPAGLERGARMLQQCGDAAQFDDGLACLVFQPRARACKTPTAEAAANLVVEFRRDLPDAMRTQSAEVIARPAILLLGLGPGLTPSGDDLLGGVMLALSALSHVQLRDALWDVLMPELGDLTNEISAMHLALAADGQGSEAMHAALEVILTGEETTAAGAIARAAATGHTSGWDTLAGIAIAIDAWQAAKSAG